MAAVAGGSWATSSTLAGGADRTSVLVRACGVLDGVKPKPSIGVNKQLPAVELLEGSVSAAARGEYRNGEEGENRTAQHVSWTIGR